MDYEPELLFLRETFRKCHIQTVILDSTLPLYEQQELYMHALLNNRIDTAKSLQELLPLIKPNAVYAICDPFLCKYIFLPLPGLGWEAILVIGPYLPAPLTHQQILECGEENSILPSQQQELKNLYGNIPILPETSHLFALLETFCQRLWGPNGFTFEERDQEHAGTQALMPQKKSPSDEKGALWYMHNMELRYACENELMNAVAQGQSHKVDLLLSNFSTFSFEQRLPDPVRNVKNYCIIMNTLLRKAAEKGGVHPVYLDSASSAFAGKIEQLDTLNAVMPLVTEMSRSYCQLVRKHSMKNYSPSVQKVIACIDLDLTADLSLSTLSRALNISNSYLSTIFKKETKQTLTDYITHRRISHARHLLETTSLRIQTVAQHCGIGDVHYFSKIFKRITGMPPRQYRESHSR